MVMKRDLTWDGEHTLNTQMVYNTQNCAPGAYIDLLTKSS